MSQGAHGLKPFLILHDIFGTVPVDAIPILGGHNGHPVDGKVFIEPVKGCGGTAAASADYGCGRLEGITAAGIKGPIQQCAEGAVGAGIVDWGADHDAIGPLHFLRQRVGAVVVKNTAPQLSAGMTGNTAPDRGVPNVENFCLDSLRLRAFTTYERAV